MKPGVDLEVLNAARYWQQYRDSGPYTLDQMRALAAEHGEEINELRGMATIAREYWLWHWADSGFTTFRCAASYAAALMVTDPNQDHAGDLIIPWRAVRIEVPEGLLETEACHVRWIYLFAGTDTQNASLAYSDRAIMAENHYDDLAADGAIYRLREGSTLGTRRKRGSCCCARTTRAACCTRSSTRATGVRASTKTGGGWGSATAPRPPPTHRNVVCGRPITVNLRAMVHAQARGETRRSAPAMFQSCVRGHYKRQVIGVGRSGRKVIWIEPYWRGPEGAPLLVRPYEFTG